MSTPSAILSLPPFGENDRSVVTCSAQHPAPGKCCEVVARSGRTIPSGQATGVPVAAPIANVEAHPSNYDRKRRRIRLCRLAIEAPVPIGGDRGESDPQRYPSAPCNKGPTTARKPFIRGSLNAKYLPDKFRHGWRTWEMPPSKRKSRGFLQLGFPRFTDFPASCKNSVTDCVTGVVSQGPPKPRH